MPACCHSTNFPEINPSQSDDDGDSDDEDTHTPTPNPTHAMKPPSSLLPTTAPLLLLALLAAAPATTIAAATVTEAAPQAALDCANLLVDGHKYNLQALAGPHVVVTSEYTRPTWHNSTYAVDVCGVLKRKEGVGKEERCPDGSRGMFSFLSGFEV